VPHGPDIQSVIASALEVLPHQAEPKSADRLAELAELLCEWGARINLSGHRSAAAIAESLIADAIGVLATLERHLGEPLKGRVVDLGSGAGFPGLPIAVIRGGCEVFMVESRERRHYFQRAAKRHLEATNAHPLLARIEDVPVAAADHVIAQAVGPITDVVAAMRPYAESTTTLVVPGSDALEAPEGTDDLVVSTIHYRAPITDRPRSLWVGVRSKPPISRLV
jgi:16S rRNA (guanine527-N7)-methyltransferase